MLDEEWTIHEACVWWSDMAIPSLTFSLVMLMLRHAAQLLPPSFRLHDGLMLFLRY